MFDSRYKSQLDESETAARKFIEQINVNDLFHRNLFRFNEKKQEGIQIKGIRSS